MREKCEGLRRDEEDGGGHNERLIGVDGWFRQVFLFIYVGR